MLLLMILVVVVMVVVLIVVLITVLVILILIKLLINLIHKIGYLYRISSRGRFLGGRWFLLFDKLALHPFTNFFIHISPFV